VSSSASPSDQVQRIWLAARPRRGPGPGGTDRRRPSAAIGAVLLALLDGPVHGGDIARRTGQAQPEVTSRRLPRLERYGFVRPVERVPGRGHQGGGRPAVIWALTERGRGLAGALVAEQTLTNHSIGATA